VRLPDDRSVRRWYEYKQFGSMNKRHSAVWPRRSEENVHHVRRAFIRTDVTPLSESKFTLNFNNGYKF
jgi:hypothetical protein